MWLGIKKVRDVVKRHSLSYALLTIALGAGLLWYRFGWEAVGGLLGHGNAPAWVQAVGSVGAIFAAIWTVNRENAKREEQRLVLASLTSVTVFRQVIAIREFALKWQEIFQIHGDEPGSVSDPDEIYQRFVNQARELDVPSFGEMQNLIAAPDRAAKKIARAVANIRMLTSSLDETLQRRLRTVKEERIIAYEARSALLEIPEHMHEVAETLFKLINDQEDLSNWLL